ncbi:MAG: ergothioneine biosynthesis protein EgtB [Gemmatimonadaceae bacterium]
MAQSLLIAQPDNTRVATSRHTTTLATLAERFDAVRAQTEHLCEPLDTEDYVVSSMADVSPTKWHLAHTSWFFETFILAAHAPEYVSPNPRYAYLFNSYYVQAGERHCRAMRGLVTRPTVREVFEYRAHVTEAMRALLLEINDDASHPAYPLIVLGLHHEQQHQELLVTDIKHVFWMNPLRPVYRERPVLPARTLPETAWKSFEGGVHRIGHQDSGFSFDNELPAHREFLEDYKLASRLVTNGDYLDFINDGGYKRSELWLSPGLAMVNGGGWEAPLYWERADDGWTEFTLAGTKPVVLDEPVCHVSYYEADAFARWAQRRLPTEAEWEVAARDAPIAGTFVESERFHPAPASDAAITSGELTQLYGDVWQWTQSAYVGYPGFKADTGAIGEYNGKWMADQWVLRGASCATPKSHVRLTYRNFFPSDARWQFMGIRLADHA